MKTKIVYVITSTGLDIYVEQTYMSIWSCKHYNPDANIVVVTDDDSLPFINKYKEINELTSELISVPFDENISKAERSRFLKTSLRSLVKGDFLYVDGDTIFCDSVSEIDNFNFQIALVEDLHSPTLYQSPVRKHMISRSLLIFGVLPPFNSKYYNGGVMYVKDSQISHKFFKEWHQNWLFSNKKTGLLFDQPGLFQAYLNFKDHISPLSGIYNAQLALSDKFLKKGKIMHFFTSFGKEGWHPFINSEYYKEIKSQCYLTDNVKSDILHFKDLYDSSHIYNRFSFLPKFISTPLRIVNRFYKYNFLSYFLFFNYKNFYNKYIKVLNDSRIRK